MCFRPVEAELPPVVCSNCEKKINRTGGELPSKCPFCKEPTAGLEEPESSTPAAPTIAPPVVAPPTPKIPKAPTPPPAPPKH